MKHNYQRAFIDCGRGSFYESRGKGSSRQNIRRALNRTNRFQARAEIKLGNFDSFLPPKNVKCVLWELT
jgi:hypothetical protein